MIFPGSVGRAKVSRWRATLVMIGVLLMVAWPASAQDMLMELSGYVGGEGYEKVNAKLVKDSGKDFYQYAAGVTTSKESWMPPGPARGGVAPECFEKRLKGKITIQCGAIGPRNGFIARYDNIGNPTGFAFIGSGSGMTVITDMAMNSEGDIFVVGWTSDELRHSWNRYKGGDRDGFIAKIDTSHMDPNDPQSELESANRPTEWAQHLGGDGRDLAYAVSINSNGNPVVVGETDSDNFPTRGVDSGSDTDTNFGDTEEQGDDIQKKKNIGVIKPDQPVNSNEFHGGDSDGFVTMVPAEGMNIQYSYYLGGAGADVAKELAVSTNGLVIVGSSNSSEIRSPWGTLEDTISTNNDNAFVFKRNVIPTRRDTGQIIGSSGSEQTATGVGQIELYSEGRGIVVTGNSGGPLETETGTNSSYQGGSSDGFVALYNSIHDDIPKRFQYLGGSGTDRINDMQVVERDRIQFNSVYLAGSTDSDDFPTQGGLPNQMLNSQGKMDAFMAELGDQVKDFRFNGIVGGSDSDQGLGLAVTQGGIFHMVGSTGSDDFYFKRNPDSDLQGATDGFLSRLIPEQLKATDLSIAANSPGMIKRENAPVPFDLDVQNEGNNQARGITLTGEIQGGTINSVPNYCSTPSNRQLTCDIGDLNSGMSEFLTVDVMPATAPQRVKGSFEVAMESREFNHENNQATDSTDVISRIDLEVTHIEVTQGIQDWQQSLPLVKNHTTYARVYVKASRETVDSGHMLVDAEAITAGLTGKEGSRTLAGSPISPVTRTPSSLEQIEGTYKGTSVSVDPSDTLMGTVARGRVGAGIDGYRYTGSQPTVNLDVSYGANTHYQKGKTIVIAGKDDPGETSYRIEANNLMPVKNDTLLGYDVSVQPDDNVRADTATGAVGAGADGYRFDGDLHQLHLDNPQQATILVEDADSLFIEGKSGGTVYTIQDTTKLDANTDDRLRRQAFDFRIPSEWIGNESLTLEATVSSGSSFEEHLRSGNNSLETESFELRESVPICMRTFAVRTNSSLPNANLTSTRQGSRMHSLAEALLPATQIKIYPNNSVIEPGWAEPGNTFEFDENENSPDNFDSGKVLNLLRWRARVGSSPDWCSNRGARTHWAGLVNASDVDGPGGTAIGPQLFWFALSPGMDDWGQINSPFGGTRIAHELGHNYDLNHVNCGNPNDPENPDGPYENYPFNNCQLSDVSEKGFWGYDTRNLDEESSPPGGGQRGLHPDLLSVAPRLSGSFSDIMSYADHRWISSYTWKKLSQKYNNFSVHFSFNRYDYGSEDTPVWKNSPSGKLVKSVIKRYATGATNAGPVASRRAATPNTDGKVAKQYNRGSSGQVAIPDQMVIVDGTYDIRDEVVTSLRAIEMNSSTIRADKARELLDSGPRNPDFPVSVQLRDKNSDLLDSAYVELIRQADAADSGQRSFSVALPWNTDAAEVNVAMFGNTLAGQELADSQPSVEIQAPTGDEQLVDEPVTARWEVSGVPQPDSVTYMIHYSNDGGDTWQSLDLYHRSQSFTLDPSQLAGSTDNALLRVVAMWKGRSGRDTSEPFSVAGHAPDVGIQSPDSGPDQSYIPGGQAYLEGRAYDQDEGYLTGDALQWTISRGEWDTTGTGEQMTVYDLRSGIYKLSLTATDSDGMQATATRQFIVGQMDSTIDRKEERPEEMISEERQDSARTEDNDQPSESQPQLQEDQDEPSVTLIPRGGMSLPGVSSVSDVSGQVGRTFEGQDAIFTWGGSIAFGTPGSYNFRLSGIHRSGTISSAQDGQGGPVDTNERFTAFSADLLIRPLPRLLVQPYAVGGFGFRKISVESLDSEAAWKTTIPIGVGVDIQLGNNGPLLGIEAIDYLSGFSGNNNLRHDAFLLGYIGIPF